MVRPQWQEWTVNLSEAGSRLDHFLRTHLAVCSRREIHAALTNHAVLLNNHPAHKSSRLKAGDVVSAAVHTQLCPNPLLCVSIISQDAAFVALDKPRGVPSVALTFSETHAVANYLAAAFPESVSAGSNPREAGLVHRLDTPTSGILLAARTTAAYQHIRSQLRQRSVYKEYVAVVEGDFRHSGDYEFNLAPQGQHRKRVCIVPIGSGQIALSHYQPLEQRADETLVRIVIRTGARHQIRAHLSALGHPVKGDMLYGSRSKQNGLLLHAHKMIFDHPETAERISLISAVPDEFHGADQKRLATQKEMD